MAIGQVTKYNNFQSNVMKSAERQWDDGVAGNVMFILATAAYTPLATHSTVNDLGANYISAGDGAPINATALDLDDTTTPGTVHFDSAAADYGTTVTVTAKYLIAIQPATPGSISTADELLFYVDLNTDSGAAVASSTDSIFKINPPANGWVSI